MGNVNHKRPLPKRGTRAPVKPMSSSFGYKIGNVQKMETLWKATPTLKKGHNFCNNLTFLLPDGKGTAVKGEFKGRAGPMIPSVDETRA